MWRRNCWSAPLEPGPDPADTVASLLDWSNFEKQIRVQEALDRLPGCVLYGDMDQLHVLNKLAGFAVGDLAISEVGAVLQTSDLPQGSCACHLSGDRFTVYAPRTTLAQGRRLAEQLSKTRRRALGDRAWCAFTALHLIRCGADSLERRRARSRAGRCRSGVQSREGSRPRPHRGLPGRGPEHRPPQRRRARGGTPAPGTRCRAHRSVRATHRAVCKAPWSIRTTSCSCA